jgi:hypothetical protein
MDNFVRFSFLQKMARIQCIFITGSLSISFSLLLGTRLCMRIRPVLEMNPSLILLNIDAVKLL